VTDDPGVKGGLEKPGRAQAVTRPDSLVGFVIAGSSPTG